MAGVSGPMDGAEEHALELLMSRVESFANLPEKGTAMRSMTWNIGSERSNDAYAWDDRLLEVRSTVEHQKPAVFAAQDCTKSMYISMTKWMTYVTQFDPNDEGTGEGLVILSNMPIRRSWHEILPIGKNCRKNGKVLWAKIGDKLVGNVRLSYDIADAAHQLKALLEGTAHRANVLMGDFNAYADDLETFNRLVKSQGWISTFDGPWSAVDGRRKPAGQVLVRNTQVLDFDARNVTANNGETQALDHRPVVVDVVFQSSDILRRAQKAQSNRLQRSDSTFLFGRKRYRYGFVEQVVRSACRGALVGFGFRASVDLFPNILKSVMRRSPKIFFRGIMSSLLGLEQRQYAAYASMSFVTFNSVMQLSQESNVHVRLRAAAAAFLTTPALSFAPRNSRLPITLFAFSRALEVRPPSPFLLLQRHAPYLLHFHSESRQVTNNVSSCVCSTQDSYLMILGAQVVFNLAALRGFPFGRILKRNSAAITFAFANAQILFAWFFQPYTLPPSLKRFLDAMSGFPRSVVEDVAALHRPGKVAATAAYIGRTVPMLQPDEPLWRVAYYGIGAPKGGSFAAGAAWHLKSCIFLALKVYLPLHLIPVILKSLIYCFKALMGKFYRSNEERANKGTQEKPIDRLTRFAKRFLINVCRSSAFLGGNVAIAGALVCFFHLCVEARGGKNTPFQGWLAGMLSGAIAIHFERTRQRIELAMYFLPHALRSSWRGLAKGGLLPKRVNMGEYPLYAAALSLISFAALSELHADKNEAQLAASLRPVFRKIIRRTLHVR